MLSSLTRKPGYSEKGTRGVLSVVHVPWGRLQLAYTYSLLSEGSGRRNEMEQPRDGTRRVGSNKRQIYSSESRGMREEKQVQARQQAGSETLPIVVGRGCIDQDEAGRRSLLRLYFRCCPCSCLLAPSRKPSLLRPLLSRRPSLFFFGSLRNLRVSSS